MAGELNTMLFGAPTTQVMANIMFVAPPIMVFYQKQIAICLMDQNKQQ